MVLGSTRVAYTRPGLMMRVPTSSTQKTPYLFRTGFGTEIHNFDPFNTAKGVYFDMELNKGFAFGFSAVQGGDTTRLALIAESQYKPAVELNDKLGTIELDENLEYDTGWIPYVFDWKFRFYGL